MPPPTMPMRICFDVMENNSRIHEDENLGLELEPAIPI
jgi:hypothetical protein